MASLRMISILGASLLASACSKPVQTVAVAAPCPVRVVTWMACPGALAREGSTCMVFGPELGCGLDQVALEYATRTHANGRTQSNRGRFYVFAIEVTPDGARRVSEADLPERPASVVVDF